MGLSAQSVKRGEAATTGEHLPKTELVGELVAFAVNQYDPQYVGKYGVQPRADVDLLVVTGPHAGTHDPSWVTHGNLAAQMGSQDRGATIIARITSGPGSAPGSKWFGADFDVDDNDVKTAKAAILGVADEKPKTKSKAPAADEDLPF